MHSPDGYYTAEQEAFVMTLSSAAKDLLTKINDWWSDHQDERLDQLVASEYQSINDVATRSGATAYELVNRARPHHDSN